MSLRHRKLSYSLAINEALRQMMERDGSVFLIGQGVKSPWYVGATAAGLLKRFGPLRVIDTPVSENAITGVAVGAAIAGMRSIVVHPRIDFMIYALDPVINEAANWHYMSGGKSSVPIVVWAIINRGGEQGAQHSQSIHALFSHIPGLKVVMPATPYDAKGLMVAAIRDNNPVLYIDDRWLYDSIGDVPQEVYEVPIGKGIIRKKGHDITIVASSYMAVEAVRAAEQLIGSGVDAEVIDLRTIKPMDTALVLDSVRRTGRLVIADGGWKSFGVSAEIAASIAEDEVGILKSPIRRVALPDCPAPSSSALEKEYYPTSADIVRAALSVVNKSRTNEGRREKKKRL